MPFLSFTHQNATLLGVISLANKNIYSILIATVLAHEFQSLTGFFQAH